MSAAVKGPEWWYSFLRAKNVKFIRVWWSLGMRESGGDPGMLYPAGAPWGDWVNGNGRKFDVGTLQVNVVHLDSIRAIWGQDKDMSFMLDPNNNLAYAQRLAAKGFLDWGLKVSAAGTSYAFDWSSYPSDWVTAYAKNAENGFTHWWNEFPKYAAPNPLPSGPKPKPPVSTAKKPVIHVASVQPGKRNYDVKVVQIALNSLYKSGLAVDGAFGPRTQVAYDKFRRELMGWSGPDATGSVGRSSLAALGAKAGFTVVA